MRIRLQDQPLQILRILLEHPGEVATREDIQARLWPDGTVVDFDNAINSAVRRLRDALGDKAENPRFIETLARRGYRFIAPVSSDVTPAVSSAAVPPAAEPGPTPVSSIVPAAIRGAGRRAWPLAFVLVGLAAATLGLAAWVVRTANHPASEGFKVTPLTTYPGSELEPSFSPDGTRVAFAWDGPAQDNFDIYVKLIGPGDPIRLTRDASADRNPAWSPDGRWIAFLRELSERESAVMLVPAMGGPERELRRVGILWISTWAVPGRYLAWSADGKTVFTIDRRSGGGAQAYKVVAVSVDSGEERPITDPPPGVMGDGGLSVSPDGGTLAYARSTAYRASQLFTLQLSRDLRPGKEIRLDSGDDPSGRACSIDWTPDGRDIVFSTCGYGMWRRPKSGSGAAVRLAGIGENSRNLAISREGHRLVYSDGGEDENIWRVAINSGHPGPPAPFLSSTRSETMMQYSPDGQRIAFESDRSGVEEIWVCDQDGANAVQLTSFGVGWSGTPRWSPDGRYIVFDRSDADGPWGIYMINSHGGKPVVLVNHGSNNLVPSWSRDGQWIYFTSDRTGRSEIYQIPAAGGEPVQVTRNGGYAAVESPDGAELYYKRKSDTDALWTMPVKGGEERKVLDSVYDRDFAVTTHGIYFSSRAGKSAQVRYFDFATRRITSVVSYRPRCPGLAVSPDEHWVLFTRVDLIASDLMLVESFR